MSDAKIPPGPKGLPLFGSMFEYNRDPLGFLTRCAREYGDVSQIRLPGMAIYMLNHPEHIEYVLRGNHRNFVKDHFSHQLSALVGQGLITSEGEVWRRQRTMSAPVFQMHQIQKYSEVMVDYTERMLAGWRDGETRDIHHEMMHLTLDIVARTLFATDVAQVAADIGRCLEAAMDYYSNWITLLPPSLQWLPTPTVLRFRKAVKEMDRIIYGIIAQHRAQPPSADNLLSRLLAARDEQGQGMSDQQLRDELTTLILAGHETTALSLSYSFYLLTQHPDIEQKLAAEVTRVLAGRPPTAADLPNMPYTDWVVKEVMRLYPPAWSVGREPLADCEIGGFLIPKGAQISISQYVVHRDPRWFQDPDAFRPERWDNDFIKHLPRCTYFPFGDGPRTCIGNNFALLEAALILSATVQRYHLTSAPAQTLKVSPSITLRPIGGMKMVLHKR